MSDAYMAKFKNSDGSGGAMCPYILDEPEKRLLEWLEKEVGLMMQMELIVVKELKELNPDD